MELYEDAVGQHHNVYSVFGSFTRSIAQYGYIGKGWMGKSRLFDCILICIVNWTVASGSFTRGIAYLT